MKRRWLLVLAGGSLTMGSAGCLSNLDDETLDNNKTSDSNNTSDSNDTSDNDDISEIVPSEMTNWVLDTNIEITDHNHDSANEEPKINVNPKNSTVIIIGVTHEHNSCHSVAATPSYDATTGTLSVDVFSESTEDGPCLSQIYSQSYRLVITFDQGIPEQIQINEGQLVELERSY